MKITDAALEKCLCTKCGKYLSYPPVVIHHSEHFHGQCCDGLKELHRASEYEALANFFKFPCVNKSEGCPEYFSFGEAALEHLNDCPYKPLDCPFNESKVCNWKGSVPKLPLHFENNHPEYYLQKAIFRMDCNVTQNQYYLFVIKDEFIILQSRCDLDEKSIWLNAILLPFIQNGNVISYNFKLMPLDVNKPFLQFPTKTVTQTSNSFIDISTCNKLDLHALSSIFAEPYTDCHWTIDVQPQAQVLSCPECHITMIPPIFRCRNGHTICGDCKNSESCSKCETVYTKAVDLETVSKKTKHSCRFGECPNMDYDALRVHEIECIKLGKKWECWKCQSYLTDHVFSCSAGHIFCESCSKGKVYFSPCGHPITRNKHFEHAFKALLYECRWNNCDAVCQAGEIIIHENICKFLDTKHKCSVCNNIVCVIWYCHSGKGCSKLFCSSCSTKNIYGSKFCPSCNFLLKQLIGSHCS